MIEMTYDPILGVRYTFTEEQPQKTIIEQTKVGLRFAREKSMTTKRVRRNNTKQK